MSRFSWIPRRLEFNAQNHWPQVSPGHQHMPLGCICAGDQCHVGQRETAAGPCALTHLREPGCHPESVLWNKLCFPCSLPWTCLLIPEDPQFQWPPLAKAQSDPRDRQTFHPYLREQFGLSWAVAPRPFPSYIMGIRPSVMTQEQNFKTLAFDILCKIIGSG